MVCDNRLNYIDNQFFILDKNYPRSAKKEKRL